MTDYSIKLEFQTLPFVNIFSVPNALVVEYRVENMAWNPDYRDNTTQLYAILKVSLKGKSSRQ
jgi:hypothetical protein